MPKRTRTKRSGSGTSGPSRKRQQQGPRKKRKRKIKRRHKTDALTHAKRRHARTQRHSHKARMYHEAQTINRLLSHLLQTASSTEALPYHFDKRHHTKDPEYRWETAQRREFKQGFPAPDVSMLRPQADDLPPHWGNYPLGAVEHRR